MSEYDNDLLREGILRAKVKEFDAARRYLRRALDSADDLQTRMQACYWLSEIATDLVEKRNYLEEVLAIDRNFAPARRALAILDGKLKPEEIVDPDRLPTPAPGEKDVQADRFTCPKCGGRMAYAADGRSLVCEFCQRDQPLAGASAAGQDFLLAMATLKGHSEPVATQVFQCRGCGSDFVLPPQALTATCAYCGSNHVVALEQARDLVAPDAVIPMAFTQKQATWRLVHWVDAHRLKPQNKVRVPRGFYLPVWTFEAGGEIPWNGIRYHDKQKVKLSGLQGVHYDDLAVPATRQLADLLESILPGYDFPAAVAYDPRYLAGWPAEVYQMSLADAALEARAMAVERLRRGINLNEGYHVLNLHYSPSNIAIESFRLILVPLWITEVRLDGEDQRVVINGQTGAVHGKMPQHGLLEWLGDLIGAK